METGQLAAALRNKATQVRNVNTTTEAEGQTLRDAAELLRVLANVVEGKPLGKAFGPPGDWGYETEIGAAIAASPTAPSAAKEVNIDNILDVREKYTRLRDIRAMAGRAMLDGPHDYKTAELEGPLLDLAVAKAVGLAAVIHKIDNPIGGPFFECCVLSERGRLQYQYMPSRLWDQGGRLVDEHRISLIERGEGGWIADMRAGCVMEAETPLLCAMRALVESTFGDTVRM